MKRRRRVSVERIGFKIRTRYIQILRFEPDKNYHAYASGQVVSLLAGQL